MQAAPPPAFAELYARSCFSFLTGASHPEELVEQAVTHGYAALAITDECSMAGNRARLVGLARTARRRPATSSSAPASAWPTGPISSSSPPTGPPTGGSPASSPAAAGPPTKAATTLTRSDLDDGLPGCLALLVPPDDTSPGPALADDARWLAARFPGKTWLAAPLLLGPDDAARRAWIADAASSAGIPGRRHRRPAHAPRQPAAPGRRAHRPAPPRHPRRSRLPPCGQCRASAPAHRHPGASPPAG